MPEAQKASTELLLESGSMATVMGSIASQKIEWFAVASNVGGPFRGGGAIQLLRMKGSREEVESEGTNAFGTVRRLTPSSD